MAVRTREEVINAVKARIADDVSDDALALLEDVTDTLDDYDRRINESGDWERKYQENDDQWRRRYRERFENRPSVDVPNDTVEFVAGETEVKVLDSEETSEGPKTYEELFKGE